MDISISCQNRFLICILIGSFRESDYPCLCLCFRLEQITIIRPRLRINRHFSQILRTEALIFIFLTLILMTFWKKKSFLKFSTSNRIPTKGMLKWKKLPNLSNPCYGVDILYVLYVLWWNHNDLLQF